MNGNKVASLADAARFIREQAAQEPKIQAVIAADKEVAYGRVVDLIDLVKQNGISAFALDVERRPAPAGTP